MFKNFIICFLLIITTRVSITCGIFYSGLVETRRQLESTRMELSAATNRQSELAEILRRDGEILNESFTTISGIRSQIAVIRESYETMENILSGNNDNGNK